MKSILIAHSESEMRAGLPFLETWVETSEDPISVILPGSEGKVLSEQVSKIVAEHFDRSRDSVAVACVSAQSDEIVAAVEEINGDRLLIVDRATKNGFLTEVFQKVELPTLWLTPAHDMNRMPQRLHQIRLGANEAAPKIVDQLLHTTSRYQIEIPESNSDEGNEVSLSKRIESLLATHAFDKDDLIVFAFDDPHEDEASVRDAVKARGFPLGCGVAILHDGLDRTEATAAWIHRTWARVAPPMSRDERSTLANELSENSSPNAEFIGLISASSMLAAFGLLQNSAAVIIGAMLIAPLMTPIMGAGMAIAQGNRPLFRRSTIAILVGFIGAFAASFLFGVLYCVLHSGRPLSTPEMLNRCQPGPLDFLVGLVGGLAASYARTRQHLSAALAGAAIAAALVPPIATAGLHLSFQPFASRPIEPSVVNPVIGPILPPLVLVGINVLTIMIGSSFILWSRGIRADGKFGLRQRWSVRMIALITFLGLMVLLWTFHKTGM